MADPGAPTNIKTDSNASAVTSVSLTLDAGTTDKWSCLGLEGLHASDSLTVDTTGWTALAILEHVAGPTEVTIVFAYEGGSADTAVAWSWDTGAGFCVIAGHQANTDFGSVAPTQETDVVSGVDPVTHPTHEWIPTTTDIRAYSFIAIGDATRTIDTFPDADNNTEIDSGGAGDPLLGFCTAGVTATSPYDAGDWDMTNVVRAALLAVSIQEVVAAATVYPPWPRVQRTLPHVRM